MAEPEALKTSDGNVYLPLANGGGVLVREASERPPRERRYRIKQLALEGS